jgi:MFS superfamily sulfate permease-like transporter
LTTRIKSELTAFAARVVLVMGIITAVWTGIATSLLGGSDYNISGPTGVLSVCHLSISTSEKTLKSLRLFSFFFSFDFSR